MNAIDKYKYTPLYYAFLREINDKSITDLITSGANINLYPNPLIESFIGYCYEYSPIKRFIQFKPDLTLKYLGRTPFESCIYGDNIKALGDILNSFEKYDEQNIELIDVAINYTRTHFEFCSLTRTLAIKKLMKAKRRLKKMKAKMKRCNKVYPINC